MWANFDEIAPVCKLELKFSERKKKREKVAGEVKWECLLLTQQFSTAMQHRWCKRKTSLFQCQHCIMSQGIRYMLSITLHSTRMKQSAPQNVASIHFCTSKLWQNKSLLKFSNADTQLAGSSLRWWFSLSEWFTYLAELFPGCCLNDLILTVF